MIDLTEDQEEIARRLIEMAHELGAVYFKLTADGLEVKFPEPSLATYLRPLPKAEPIKIGDGPTDLMPLGVTDPQRKDTQDYRALFPDKMPSFPRSKP